MRFDASPIFFTSHHPFDFFFLVASIFVKRKIKCERRHLSREAKVNGAPAGGQKLPGLQFPICLIPCLDSNFGGGSIEIDLLCPLEYFPA